MNKKNKKPFIPKDKPKLWILAILSALSGLLVASPIMIIGAVLELILIKNIGVFLFMTCWVIGATTGIIFLLKMISGRYRNIEEKEWNEQLW